MLQNEQEKLNVIIGELSQIDKSQNNKQVISTKCQMQIINIDIINGKIQIDHNHYLTLQGNDNDKNIIYLKLERQLFDKITIDIQNKSALFQMKYTDSLNLDLLCYLNSEKEQIQFSSFIYELKLKIFQNENQMNPTSPKEYEKLIEIFYPQINSHQQNQQDQFDQFDKNKIIDYVSHAQGIYQVKEQQNSINKNQSVCLIQSNNKGNQIQYVFSIKDLQNNVLYSADLNNSFFFEFVRQQCMLKWVALGQSNFTCQCFIFQDLKCLQEFVTLLNKCIYEIQIQKQLDKNQMVDDVHQYQQLCFQCQQLEYPKDISNQFLNNKNPKIELEEGSYDLKITNQNKGKKINSAYAICQIPSSQQCMISNDGLIKIISTDFNDEGFNEVNHEINQIKVNNVGITPENILLPNIQDEKFVILDQLNKKSAYYFDMNKQKIIQEYSLSKNSIESIAPQFKNQTSSNFLAIDKSSIKQIDPKCKKYIVNEKQYKSINNFSSICSTTNGRIAIGAQNGDIRLYDEIGKNAKNLYHIWGDEIIHLDVSVDEKWLLCTYKNYINLIPTFNDKVENGYLKNLSKNKPPAIKLTLSPEDICQKSLQKCEFRDAYFDRERGEYIVATVDNIIILWSMKDIISNNLFKYQIIQKEKEVINSEFLQGTQEQLLIYSIDTFSQQLVKYY